jgi:putative flippase GtrA
MPIVAKTKWLLPYRLIQHKVISSLASDNFRKLKFCVIGALNTVLSMALFFLLLNKAKIPALYANLLSYIFGVITGYLGNTLWSFADSNKSIKSIRHLTNYIISNASMACFSTATYSILLLIFSNHSIAYILNLLISAALSYLINKFIFLRQIAAF